MGESFRKPIFEDGSLELRFENGIVCIYGTPAGLTRLSELIHDLIKKPNRGHIHLEDESKFLTKESEKGAIAIFDAS